MLVYIMRHGAALDVGEQGIRRDAERPLSPDGVAHTTQVARGLIGLKVAPQVIASSPLVRARQTAEIVARVTAPDADLVECEALLPGCPSDELIRWLRHQTVESVLLVGHMPDVAVAVSDLLAGHLNLKMEFRKAAVCALSFDMAPLAGGAQLEWFLPPKALRALGSQRG
jgi:phosphohistidine phosphatase